MRVMDIPGWPPDSGGAFQGGEVFPQSIEQVTVETYGLNREGNILFFCRFDGKSLPYDFFISDATIAEKFVNILNDNRGKTLFEWVHRSPS